MQKSVILAGHDPVMLKGYQTQMKGLFSDAIEIRLLTNGVPMPLRLEADIVVAESVEVLQDIMAAVPEGTPVVLAGRTISRAGMEVLEQLPPESMAVVLDETVSLAERIIAVLYQAGLRSVALRAGTYGEPAPSQGAHGLVLGKGRGPKALGWTVHDIGPAYLDATTLINIGELLGLDDVISKQDIETGGIEIVPGNIGISKIIKKANSFESQFEILLEATGAGIIAVDGAGVIRTFNPNAERATGVSCASALGVDGARLFAEIPFLSAMKSKRSVKDRLVKINSYDVIVSVDPIIHSQKTYGAIATVRKFNDEELKQHRFRAQIIGKGHAAKYSFANIIGSSDIITKAVSMAERMAESSSTVLITGESGTGKELFAQAIHTASHRRRYPFVAVNCGAIPENLLESELFGYEEGAFTGARKGGKPGLFELAHQGTLFLDEIGEMPQHLQMRLLRVLQEREVMRVGGDRLIPVDIRLVAATNKDLKGLIAQGQFREDLYYRLNVLQLKIPPLRSRPEDILTLFNAFREEYGGAFTLTPEAERSIRENPWRGNVREIRNCVEYLVNIGLEQVDVEDLPFEAGCAAAEQAAPAPPREATLPFAVGTMTLKKRIFILETLERGSNTRNRLGRRTISEAAAQADLYISEFEARSLLVELESQGLVEIRKGRAGTLITDRGRAALAEHRRFG